VVKATDTIPGALYIRATDPGLTTYRRAIDEELVRVRALGREELERELTSREFDELRAIKQCDRGGLIPMWRAIRGYDNERQRPFEHLLLVAIPPGYFMRRVRRAPIIEAPKPITLDES